MKYTSEELQSHDLGQKELSKCVQTTFLNESFPVLSQEFRVNLSPQNAKLINSSEKLCGGADPLGHIAMSGAGNIVFLCSESGQSGPFLPWLRYSELGRLGTP